NDGSTDKTEETLQDKYKDKNIKILNADGSLFWNGGMNNSWRAAIKDGGYDGYLWLNNDSVLYKNIWCEIAEAQQYSFTKYNKGGIYVGSTKDQKTGEFTYGGFIYTNKWTLKDQFVYPNGNFQLCEAAHGNITYVSSDVVQSEGVF